MLISILVSLLKTMANVNLDSTCIAYFPRKYVIGEICTYFVQIDQEIGIHAFIIMPVTLLTYIAITKYTEHRIFSLMTWR